MDTPARDEGGEGKWLWGFQVRGGCVSGEDTDRKGSFWAHGSCVSGGSGHEAGRLELWEERSKADGTALGAAFAATRDTPTFIKSSKEDEK
ncbi:MAG: hypothetical protein AAF570_03200 [Bacteroidota bacterium]